MGLVLSLDIREKSILPLPKIDSQFLIYLKVFILCFVWAGMAELVY